MSETVTGRHLGAAGDEPSPFDETTAMEMPERATTGETVAARQQVVCPECGATSQVTLNRRESGDFCSRCDFPLFWVRSEVLLDRSGTEESLRRLPGTAGRVSVGSADCPTCAEANPVSATTCLRCGGPMELPPPPRLEVPPAPPPAPAPEPEPEPRGQWIWVVAGVTAALLVALVLYLLLR